MKKNLFFILSICLCITTSGISAKPIFKNFKIVQVTGDPVYYSLALESIFPEKDRGRYDDAFKTLYAPFVIEEIDYANKTIVVKLTQKATYEDVKQTFDKAGLRIIKESILQK